MSAENGSNLSRRQSHDPNPAGIVSFSKARDAELENEDHVTVVLDTFLDGRSGYVFAINPSGARFDALVVSQGKEVNDEWDAVWEAKTSRDDRGWSAEIRIPIKSLGYKPEQLGIQSGAAGPAFAGNEPLFWRQPGLRDFPNLRSRAYSGLAGFDFGLGLVVRPAFKTGVEKKSRDEDRSFPVDPSLDVAQRLASNLTTILTVNTDFAETKVDTRQTNLTRFEIFFPEKRTFFLEGSDIFQFAFGVDKKVLPFFSRRIGLLFSEEADGIEIPINVGGKRNGRVGESNLGALVVNTRDVEDLGLGGATMVVVRVK